MEALGRSDRVRSTWAPLTFVVLLVAAEFTAIGLVFKHAIPFTCHDHWPRSACGGASGTLIALYCVIASLALALPLRRQAVRSLLAETGAQRLGLSLNVLGLVLCLVPALLLSNASDSGSIVPSFGFWSVGMALLLGGAGLFLATPSRWRVFWAEARSIVLPTVLAGAAMPLAATTIRPLWDGEIIAGWTFSAVVRLIEALGYDVFVDVPQKIVGAGSFGVSIAPVCSGVEGMALVSLFVTLYLVLFRRDLRFPRALVLYPLGIIASAAFNIVRITVLLVIGFEGNPGLAVGGFHSHAGWLMFTLVAMGIVYLAQTWVWLKPAQDSPLALASLPFWQDAQVARILPFAVFMLSGVALSVATVEPGAWYPLRAVVVTAVMVPFLGIYRAFGWRIDPWAVVAGIAIAVMWVVVPTETQADPSYGALGGGLLVLWLVARGFGTAVLVPILEELFFRDYLESKLRFGNSLGWTVAAAIVSGALFAALHDRWDVAFVAALVFSGLVRRKGGRVTDAVLAHAVANGLIFAVAVVTGRLGIL